MKKFMTVLLMVTLCLCLVGCGSSTDKKNEAEGKYISEVKETIASVNTGKSWGEAFGSFFSSEEWSSFEVEKNGEDGKKIIGYVDFTGEFDIGERKSKATIQFEMYEDGTFELKTLWLDDEIQISSTMEILIEDIFKDEEMFTESGSEMIQAHVEMEAVTQPAAEIEKSVQTKQTTAVTKKECPYDYQQKLAVTAYGASADFILYEWDDGWKKNLGSRRICRI